MTAAREIWRVAPAKKRVRAEFIRLALRQAIDLALDRGTAVAYRTRPLAEALTAADLAGWDAQSEVAKPAVAPKKSRASRRAKKRRNAPHEAVRGLVETLSPSTRA